MSPTSLPILAISALSSSDVLLFCGVIIAALLGLCGVLFSQIAPRQANINVALDTFLDELQKDRAVLIARCSSQDREIRENRGRIRNLEQYQQSLLRLLKDSGIGVLHLLPPQKNYEIEGDIIDVDVSSEDGAA